MLGHIAILKNSIAAIPPFNVESIVSPTKSQIVLAVDNQTSTSTLNGGGGGILIEGQANVNEQHVLQLLLKMIVRHRI